EAANRLTPARRAGPGTTSRYTTDGYLKATQRSTRPPPLAISLRFDQDSSPPLALPARHANPATSHRGSLRFESSFALRLSLVLPGLVVSVGFPAGGVSWWKPRLSLQIGYR
ncbi:MAG: hypothetical protein KDD44_08450, partial [Bdellovibrionales bacterium]|nr:hypothetical protein [Bdellovibrionales bacterium]